MKLFRGSILFQLLESKNVSNESPSTQPTTGDERQWDVSTEKTQKENTSPSEAKSTDAETELTKIICKFLYNGEKLLHPQKQFDC